MVPSLLRSSRRQVYVGRGASRVRDLFKQAESSRVSRGGRFASSAFGDTLSPSKAQPLAMASTLASQQPLCILWC